MLKKLYIKNFTLIKELEITLDGGLNIITGETGAGKSIIITAIQLLSGVKADQSYIRTGENSAIVEGYFHAEEHLKELLDREGITVDNGEIVLTRQLNRNGKNRVFINDQIVTMSYLKELTDYLVDIHGQHQHQSLLDERSHIETFDNLSPYSKTLAKYVKNYSKYSGAADDYKKSLKEYEELQERRELYRFQLKELNRYDFETDEDKKIQEELKILSNSEKLTQFSETIFLALYEDDNSILNQIKKYQNMAEELASIDPNLNSTLEMFNSSSLNIEELGNLFMEYKGRINHDPERQKQLEKRLLDIENVCFKYKRTLDELLIYKNKIENSLREFDISDGSLKEKAEKVKILETELIDTAKKLSGERKKFSGKFSKKIEEKLKRLGMENARFQIDFIKPEKPGKCLFHEESISEVGLETIRYLATTNPGNPFQPLSKIASGGEISRIMLGLKAILADSSLVPTMIFDEIDTGISGRIAEIVGIEMKKLSGLKQIICITHLHQIASLGDLHLVASKFFKKNETFTALSKVIDDDRIREIAKMIGGEKISESALSNAKELLLQAKELSYD